MGVSAKRVFWLPYICKLTFMNVSEFSQHYSIWTVNWSIFLMWIYHANSNAGHLHMHESTINYRTWPHILQKRMSLQHGHGTVNLNNRNACICTNNIMQQSCAIVQHCATVTYRCHCSINTTEYKLVNIQGTNVWGSQCSNSTPTPTSPAVVPKAGIALIHREIIWR